MQPKKYIKGEKLSEEELESVSEQLIQAKFDREKRKTWEERLKNEYGVEKEAVQKKRFFTFSKLAIAAAIVCIAGIVTYSMAIFGSSSYETIVKESIENLLSIDNHAVVIRGDETMNAEVSAAISAYKNKEYDKSIARWEAIIATGKMNGTSQYNLALCYLQKETSEPQKAIQYLLEARKVKTVQQEVNWALALAYLKVNQKENAKEILQEIIQAKAYKYKKAEILLALF